MWGRWRRRWGSSSGAGLARSSEVRRSSYRGGSATALSYPGSKLLQLRPGVRALGVRVRQPAPRGRRSRRRRRRWRLSEGRNLPLQLMPEVELPLGDAQGGEIAADLGRRGAGGEPGDLVGDPLAQGDLLSRDGELQDVGRDRLRAAGPGRRSRRSRRSPRVDWRGGRGRRGRWSRRLPGSDVGLDDDDRYRGAERQRDLDEDLAGGERDLLVSLEARVVDQQVPLGPAVDLLELLPDAVAAVLGQPVEALGGPDRARHRGGVAVLVVLDPGREPPLRPQHVVGL